MAKTGMVERCAAAIYLARNGRGAVPWSRRDASHKAPYLIDARAAIEAMREPTKAMEEAGADAVDDGETYGCHWKAEAAYVAMIDVILKEGD